MTEQDRLKLLEAWPWPQEAATTAGGFSQVVDAVDAIIEARLAPMLALDDDICAALMAARHGSYDGKSVEKHLERLLDKVRAAASTPPTQPRRTHEHPRLHR